MNPMSATPVEPKPLVPLWDVLLRVRQDILGRASGPYLYIGTPDVEWMTCFVLGYVECLRSSGVDEGADVLFGEWLRDVKKAWPGEGWAAACLRESHGDQTRALLTFLEAVAEFRALPPEALARIPWHGGGAHPATALPSWRPTQKPPSTLDLLLGIRREIGDVPGRLSLFIGAVDVRRMAGFVDGYRLCLALGGARDEEYARFERWLHEARALPAGEPWPRPLLAACGGDSERAIRRLLDLAAEFQTP